MTKKQQKLVVTISLIVIIVGIFASVVGAMNGGY